VLKVIECECGRRVRGGDDDALVAAMQAHLACEHPEVAGACRPDDLLAMAAPDEVPSPPNVGHR
jgi:hypothetical protein